MRLFIATKIPEEFIPGLKEIQQQLAKCGKLTLAKEFHITLKFLGEVNTKKVELIREKLSEIKFKNIKTSFTNLGGFPSNKEIRVIWLGLNNEDEVIKLQIEIDNKLKEIGFEKDNRFTPHITLARVKYVKDKTKLNKIFSKKLNFGSFEINKITLFNSIGTEEGYKHEVLSDFYFL